MATPPSTNRTGTASRVWGPPVRGEPTSRAAAVGPPTPGLLLLEKVLWGHLFEKVTIDLPSRTRRGLDWGPARPLRHEHGAQAQTTGTEGEAEKPPLGCGPRTARAAHTEIPDVGLGRRPSASQMTFSCLSTP